MDKTNIKALVDDYQFNVGETTISVSDRIETIVGKGENAGYQYFFLCPQCFP